VWISVKPQSAGGSAFANIAGGSEDTRWTAIGNWCDNLSPSGVSANGCKMYMTFCHEPEDASNGSGANFRAASAHVYNVFKAAAPNWTFLPIFSHNTLSLPDGTSPSGLTSAQAIFPNNPSRVANDWVPQVPGQCDAIGVDFYHYRGPVSGFSSGWCNPDKPPLHEGRGNWVTDPAYGNPASGDSSSDPDKLIHWFDYVEDRTGLTRIALGEMASYVLNPSTSYPPSQYATRQYPTHPQGALGERRDWCQAWPDFWKGDDRLELVCWYDRDSTDGFGNGRIGPNGTLPQDLIAGRNWADIANPGDEDPPPDPEDPPPVPGEWVTGQYGVHHAARGVSN
jgi:hypothetical protein